MLEINNLRKNFNNQTQALKGVSLKVKKGGITALLGGNGAGKSTTLKSISNLLASERGEVTKGSVSFSNEYIHDLDPAQLVKKGVIQVMEGRHCFEHLTEPRGPVLLHCAALHPSVSAAATTQQCQFLPTKCLFFDMPVAGRQSSSASWSNNHAPRSALKELTLSLNVATIQSFSRHPNHKTKRHHLESMGQRRSGNLGILCAVPARPRLGASSSIHIPANEFTNSSIVEYASRRLDERPADSHSPDPFSDAVTDSESVERNDSNLKLMYGS